MVTISTHMRERLAALRERLGLPTKDHETLTDTLDTLLEALERLERLASEYRP